MTTAPASNKPLKLYTSKDFDKQLKRLARKGGTADLVHRHVVAALESWARGNDPDSLKRTHHGESRLPHAAKYDLPGAHRLVTYEHTGRRIPLAVGSHAEIDQWLKQNRGRDFAVNPKTKQLSYTPATFDPEVAEGLAEDLEVAARAVGPVLARLPDEARALLPVPPATLAAIDALVTFETVEEDHTALLLRGLAYPGERERELVLQVVMLVATGQPDEARQAVELWAGQSRTASEAPGEFGDALDSGENSDALVDLSALGEADLKRLMSADSLAEWMLFLHPDQRRMVDRAFAGPARLQGVSGSGKTSVLVHRAYALARRYPGERLLVLCLNPPLVRLISHLLDTLCLPEPRERIEVLSLYDYCYRAVKAIAGPGELIERSDPVSRETLAECWSDFMDKPHAARAAAPVLDALAAREDQVDGPAYLLDELVWIRSGYGVDDRDEYLTAARAGRGIAFPKLDQASNKPPAKAGSKGAKDAPTPAPGALPPDTRQRLLGLLSDYEEYMRDGGLLDDDGVSLAAFSLRGRIADHPSLRARCVLVDESQDCSTVELAVAAAAPTDDRDGLFLAGDPVQKVFAKHHDLPRAGIDVKGRSAVLRKNYRNTRQILEAAHRVIDRFRDLSPISADDVLPPEYAYRDGSKPVLYECASAAEQAELVLAHLEHYREEELDSTCICSASADTLGAIGDKLRARGFAAVRLGPTDAPPVPAGCVVAGGVPVGIKLALPREVKGFEFRNVFLVDLSDDHVMPRGMPWEERWRVAFQLYVAMTRARDELTMSFVYNRSILLAPLDDFVVEAMASDAL